MHSSLLGPGKTVVNRERALTSLSGHSGGEDWMSMSSTRRGGLPPPTRRLYPESRLAAGVVRSTGPLWIIVSPELWPADVPAMGLGRGTAPCPILRPTPGHPRDRTREVWLPLPPRPPQCHPSALVCVSPPGPRMSPLPKDRLWNPALSKADEGCNTSFPKC